MCEEAWQPIETAPKTCNVIVAWTCADSGAGVVSIAREYSGYWLSDDDGLIDPTHWMPLPAPPTTPETDHA